MVLQKRKIIGIMGSGKQAWKEFSHPLADWIAKQNYHLLTGSGGGVMAAASEAFCKVNNRAGLCLGIIPTEINNEGQFIPLNGYPNPWVELCITSPLTNFKEKNPNQITRNYICILSSDVVVALPGDKGTKNEIDLAIRFNKPIILYGWQDQIKDVPQTVEKTNSLERVKDFICAIADSNLS